MEATNCFWEWWLSRQQNRLEFFQHVFQNISFCAWTTQPQTEVKSTPILLVKAFMFCLTVCKKSKDWEEASKRKANTRKLWNFHGETSSIPTPQSEQAISTLCLLWVFDLPILLTIVIGGRFLVNRNWKKVYKVLKKSTFLVQFLKKNPFHTKCKRKVDTQDVPFNNLFHYLAVQLQKKDQSSDCRKPIFWGDEPTK